MAVPTTYPLLRRLPDRLWVGALCAVTALVDTGPAWLRFGIGREARRLLWSRPLAGIDDALPATATRPETAPVTEPRATSGVVLLVTRSLGVGGVESVVAQLTRGLARRGWHPVVLCDAAGATADSLRSEALDVVVAEDVASADTALRGLPRVDVAEFHNAPDHLVAACRDRGFRTVHVVHTTDLSTSAEHWAREAAQVAATDRTIAVSRAVADFHARRVTIEGREPAVVVPNGATSPGVTSHDIDAARRSVGDVIGRDLGNDVVFCCLARYDSLKNVPGLVSAFLVAAASRPRMQLVVAGPVQDWLEHRCADAVRSLSPAGERVHLLGPASPRTLLAAADCFVLDSFVEGWPVAATEAASLGLPLIVPRVGGAVELVGPGGTGGLVVGNPAGPERSVSDATIARARRRVLAQANRDELAEALCAVADDVDAWRSSRRALSERAAAHFSAEAMVSGHDRLLTELVGARV